jgi:hypothetical protein
LPPGRRPRIDGGVNSGPCVALQDLDCLRAQLRREVDEVLLRRALQIERRRLGRDRLRRRRALAGHVRLRHGALDDRPHGFARRAIQHVRVRLFRDLHERFDRSAVDRDVHEDRRRGRVEVPQVVCTIW